MTTRMEQVAEKIALAVLRNVGGAVEPPLSIEKLEKNFYARWPTEGSKFPMNDAMQAALNAAIASKEPARGERNKGETWETPIADAWDQAVADSVEQYFDAARQHFDKGEPLEGTETLTDAVSAVVACIAATREWPHATQGELYNAAEGLATGSLPKEGGNWWEYQDTATDDGAEFRSFFAASMSCPDSVKFGLFYDSKDGSDEEAVMFARKAIELAGRMAEKKAVIP